MNTKRGLLFASISLVLFATLLTSPVLPAELSPIKFGISTDFSGWNAEAGKFTYEGATLAMEEANAKGGINGRKIIHTVLDDASDPAKGVSNAKRLIELENVSVLLGSCSTSSTIGVLKAADPAKMPVFGLLVAGAAAYASHNFFSQPSDRPTTEAMVARIAADGHKTFAFLYINIAWGVGNVELVKEFAPKYGLRLVSIEALDPAATDLSVLVTKVRAAKPDAVLPITLGQSSATLARAFEAVGWHPPRYENALMPKIAAKILGGYELFEGTTLFRQYDTRNPLCKKVLEDYQKRFGKPEEDMYMIAGYDTARTAIEAIRLAKDPNSRESIRDAAEQRVDILSAMGRTGTRVKYALDRHWFLGPDSFSILKVKEGKLVYID